jgi:hypothetical protein
MQDATSFRATMLQARAQGPADRSRVLVATGDPDRNRNRVREFTLENYAANPILRYNHGRGPASAMLPIGTVSGLSQSGAGTPAMRLEATIHIDLEQEFAAAVGDLWDRGLLNMVSYTANPVPGVEVTDVFDTESGRYLFTDRIAASLGLDDQVRRVLAAAPAKPSPPPAPGPGSLPVGTARLKLNRARLEALRR